MISKMIQKEMARFKVSNFMCVPSCKKCEVNIPYYRKLTLVLIKLFEIHAT